MWIGKAIVMLIFVALPIAAAIGWVLNLIALASMTSVTGLMILRVIGILIVPLGSILGYVD